MFTKFERKNDEKMTFFFHKQHKFGLLVKTFSYMVSISPSLCNSFYMWLLVKHASGPTSFEDLHAVDGELYLTSRMYALL
jgi:hypothetical protein